LRDPIFRRADPRAGRGRPVLLVPGFLAPDESLGLLGRWLRRSGFHPGGAGMRFNVGCFTCGRLNALEERAEALRGANKGRVAIIGQSHGGTLGARAGRAPPGPRLGRRGDGLAARRSVRHPPRGALHVRVVSALGSLGAPGLFSRDCLEGECCSEVRRAAERPSRARSASCPCTPVPTPSWTGAPASTPAAEHVEVQASHIGMAVNAEAYAAIGAALERFDAGVSRRRRRPSALTA